MAPSISKSGRRGAKKSMKVWIGTWGTAELKSWRTASQPSFLDEIILIGATGVDVLVVNWSLVDNCDLLSRRGLRHE